MDERLIQSNEREKEYIRELEILKKELETKTEQLTLMTERV